jgi:hypothetical protein
MQGSGASRRGIAKAYSVVIARSAATKQSTLDFFLAALWIASLPLAMTMLGCLKI